MAHNRTIPLAYLSRVFDTLSLESITNIEERENLVDRLSNDHFKLLEQLYVRLAESGDHVRLSEWIDDGRADQVGEKFQAYQILLIFEILERKGIKPFNTGQVRFVPTAHEFDWSVLPSCLRDLGVYAARYGRYRFPDDIELGISRLTKGDLEELSNLGKTMTAEIVQEINSFLRSRSLTESKEIQYLYYFLGFLSEVTERGLL